MPKLSSIVATATLASALAGPVLADSVSTATQAQMKARITELCSDPAVRARLVQSDEVCQVSPDNGETWIWIPVGIAALLGAGYMIRRKKKPTSDAPKDPTAPDAPADGEVDETPDAPSVVVEPEETVTEITSEESDKTPEEIIIEQAKSDPRFTLEGDVLKSVSIGLIGTVDLTKWTPGTVDAPNPAKPTVVYENGKERIEIEGTTDGSILLKITHFVDAGDKDKNVTVSYSPIVSEIFDASGEAVGHVPGGIIKGHTTIAVNSDGTPKVIGGAKYDSTTDAVLEEYDTDGKVVDTTADGTTGVSDILAPDTSTPAPAPEAPTPAPAPEAPTPAPAPEAPTEAPTPASRSGWRDRLPTWLGGAPKTGTVPTPLAPEVPTTDKKDKKSKK